jgi:hypothetical protein
MATVNVKTRVCNECGHAMAISRRCCPHCGRPSYFPNVDLANQPAERNKLTSRYEAALKFCDTNGFSAVVRDFENACKTSKAVFSLPVQKLHREIASRSDIFETYYDLERLKNRTEDSFGLDWAKLRPQAEIELLGDHHNLDQLHYACLSIGDVALNYGDCIVTLASPMTAHRVSCFEGNTAVLYHQLRTFEGQVRSNWENRHEICVAMFAEDLLSVATQADFPTILVQKGKTPLEDRFVEVHLFGPITVRTFESVQIDRSKHSTSESVLADAIVDKLKASGVEVP